MKNHLSILGEFKEFAVKGNVVDLAIGLAIGAAFGKIITSLVNDIIMPPISILLGKVNFSDLFWNLSGGDYASVADAKAAGAITLNYGLFINAVIDFLIVAFVIFLIVRQMNRLKRQPQPAAPDKKDCPRCLQAVPIKATRCAYCTSDLG